MTREEFERCVADAIDDLPLTVRTRLDNLYVVVEDEARPAAPPEVVIVRAGMLLGLYQGIPLSRRHPTGYSGALPDRITLFQNAIEYAAAHDDERICTLIHEVVRHEIAHHLGFNEAQVRNLEGRARHAH
jgi:predicted Zn-dependent protease with MMP-like domain